MNINFNNYKNKAIDWFHAHKREIKVGVYCLAVGVSYGFVKGIGIGSDSINHIAEAIERIPVNAGRISDSFEDVVFGLSPESLVCFVNPDNLERLAEACKDRLKANE